MTSRLALSAALLALTAGVASASGINLSWGDCGSFGALDQTNPCTSNEGSFVLVASVVAGPGLTACVGQETVIDLQTSAATINPWWQMRTGGCRPTSVSSQFAFGSLASCLDPWLGQAFGGYAYDYQPASSGHNEPNRARIRTVCAVASFDSAAMTAGSEYYICTITIDKAKSVGPDACAGCTDAVCFVLNSIKLTQPLGNPGGDPTYANGVNSQVATYNGGAPCNATPVHNRTWGSVKALYR